MSGISFRYNDKFPFLYPAYTYANKHDYHYYTIIYFMSDLFFINRLICHTTYGRSRYYTINFDTILQIV